ncbi:signal peptidase I [Lentzea tibetensis]|uniref:Signal peptidase I n=1 Tax=Lentzea tibetensis TaxID=2591470 RepID=A0A563EXG9_9PSEU|nr:signal peptidase I [Lentzea tibetensis]TWP52395.1 signal peptidase I [Lentzea tibetensis]
MTETADQTAVRTTSVRAAVGVCVEIIGWIFTAVVVGLVIASVVMMARGYRMVAVTSGSMRPTYEVGDAVLVRPGKPDDVRIGDIVVFSTGDHTQMTIHRIVGGYEVFGRGLHYRTKGDANTEPDAQLLHPDAIQGKGSSRIPQAGRIAHLLSADAGRIVLIGLLMLMIGREVVTIVQVRRRMKKRAQAAPPADDETAAGLDELLELPQEIPEARTPKSQDRSRAK